MRKIAEGVWQLRGHPLDLINVYLMEDVLIDGGTRWARSRVLRQIKNRPPRMVALTHCHPDHQGTAQAVCHAHGIPLACHEADRAAAEGRAPMQPDNRWLRMGAWVWAGKPHPVGRVLKNGDELAGFRVVHTPGHTPGHVIYFRAADRVAIAGDLLANINFITRKLGLRQPPPFFCHDPAENRRSIVTLAALRPSVVCFGHGPPLLDPKVLDNYAARIGSAPR